ncbi:cytochrome P450 monooxygenase [Fomitopsis serialis]|uniref:cytochrome P450 monooxygenase n=1 Tax=Fomitopsis serialis TaxID=139415 RepID=UPI00200786CD|nr:cytochrome P450 monooxygenase [Neoantrodia serialis]KAH9933430.1 cytochrome P450 monooxygenase [Neoantrodia serialis]
MLLTSPASVASFLAAALMLCLLYISQASKCSRLARLPPGPRSLPLLRNVHQFPKNLQYHLFAKWGQKYGDIVFMKVLQQPTLVINSLHAANELLTSRGAKYSDRSSSRLLTMMGLDIMTPFLGYGERWRLHRRLMQASFGDQAALARLRPVQQRETIALLLRLAQEPDAFACHIKRFAAALIMGSTYGKPYDEDFLSSGEAIVQMLVDVAGTPTAALVDNLPFSTYVPSWILGILFGSGLLETRSVLERVMNSSFEDAKAAMNSGTATDSFITHIMDASASKLHQLGDDEDVKKIAFIVFLAGFGALTIPVNTFLVTMALHEDVFAKAQQNIDEVVGTERLPDLSDRDSLPYVDAILWEVYRINPPLRLSVPRRVMEEDEYCGYRVPKGTLVLPNIWQMAHDANHYTDPDTFNPDRFIDPATGKHAGLDPREYIFSFGRRACPGQRFSDDSLWLVTASIIATFNVKKALDAEGREIMPSLTVKLPGLTGHLEKFECSIQPRSQRALELIAESSMRSH